MSNEQILSNNWTFEDSLNAARMDEAVRFLIWIIKNENESGDAVCEVDKTPEQLYLIFKKETDGK